MIWKNQYNKILYFLKFFRILCMFSDLVVILTNIVLLCDKTAFGLLKKTKLGLK